MSIQSIIIKLIGFGLVYIFLRQGVKRKYNPFYYIALGRARKTQDLMVSALGVGALIGFIIIIFSSNQHIVNVIIAVASSFIVAPILAWATVKRDRIDIEL